MAKCKVTIMNDTSLFDGHGFVHTWIKLEKEGEEPKYIGFTINGTDLRGTVPLDAPGKFQVEEKLALRPANHEISFDITEEQYTKIRDKTVNTDEIMKLRMRAGLPRANAVKYVHEKHGVNTLSCVCAIDRATLSTLMDYWVPGVQVAGISELVGNALVIEGEQRQDLTEGLRTLV